MIENERKIRVFTRRVIVIALAKLSLLFVLLCRLLHLQYIKGDDYKLLSENNRLKFTILPPKRGRILDYKSRILANNKKVFRVVIDKERAGKNASASIAKLGSLLSLTEDECNSLVKEVSKSPLNSSVVLMENISWQQLSILELNSFDLPGVYIATGYIRDYLCGALFSHVIGYVGSLTVEEKKKFSSLYHPDIKIGKNGIEKHLEEELKGAAGYRRYEVDAVGAIKRELELQESLDGKNIKLTLDYEVQKFLAQELNQFDGAAAIAMNVENGKILSLYSAPSFEPNQFNKGISNEEWNSLISNPYLPLTNKAISMVYPPGSTFKLVVALAALEEGINSELLINCTGSYAAGNRTFHCWKRTGHGIIYGIKDAIKQSCNCYIWTIANEIGMDKIAVMAKKLGMGSKLNIELPRESSGIIPSKEWKQTQLGEKWQVGDTLNSAIGQGYNLATPLQQTVLAARIASGKILKPTIIDKDEISNIEKLDIAEKNLNIVRSGMNLVVNDNKGTAFRYRITDKAIAMAGKTCTAQVVSKKTVHDDYSKQSVKRKLRHHGMFIAFAPVDKPKYACSIITEHSGTPRPAIKVARNLLQYLQLNQI